MHKDLAIRNSTIDFLIFTKESGQSIEAKYFDENVWLTQKLIAKLFDVKVPTINEHLKNIYSNKELNKNSTIRKFLTVQKEGNRKINRKIDFYNLDAIISVGYRVNSKRATNFRIWATRILKQFAIKGFALDKKRLENGSYLSKNYFDELLAEIREIRFLHLILILKNTGTEPTNAFY